MKSCFWRISFCSHRYSNRVSYSNFVEFCRFLRWISRLPFCSRESKSGHEEDKLASLCCSYSTTRKSFWLDHHRPATSVRGPREPLPRTVRWVAFFAAALFRFQVAFSHELFLSVAHIFFEDPFVCTEFLETPWVIACPPLHRRPRLVLYPSIRFANKRTNILQSGIFETTRQQVYNRRFLRTRPL